jgi:hypothetical protein
MEYIIPLGCGKARDLPHIQARIEEKVRGKVRKGRGENTRLQPPNKMPLNPPRQNLRLLHQLLSVILSEMLLFGLIVKSEDIGCGFEFRDRYEAYLHLYHQPYHSGIFTGLKG